MPTVLLFAAFQQQNPAVYQASTGSLNQEQQNLMIEIFKKADEPQAMA
jgi:hypothetical protein